MNVDANKVHCVRTKAETIIENVLASKSIEIELVLCEMFHGVSSNDDVVIAIAWSYFRCTQQRKSKMFPVVVRYFSARKKRR